MVVKEKEEVMWDHLTIDELVERAQESSGKEAAEILRELARRYREGDGVEANAMEAEYWESLIVDDSDSSEEDETFPAQMAEDSSESESAEEESGYGEMDTRTLRRRSQEGDLWAAYYFAERLEENGEAKAAEIELKTLAERVERQLGRSGDMDDVRELMGMVQLRMGHLLEMRGAYDEALRCYDVAMEAGFDAASEALLKFYMKNGAENYENELRALLPRMENGAHSARRLAADAYRALGQKTLAVMLYQELLEEPCSAETKVQILESLVNLGSVDAETLKQRSEDGDAAATFLRAVRLRSAATRNEAEAMFKHCVQQDSEFNNLCESWLAQIEADRAAFKAAMEEEHKRQIAQAQQRAEQAAKEAEEKRKHPFKAFWDKHPVITVIACIWLCCMAFNILKLPVHWISMLSLEPLDAFEEVVVSYGGGEPYGYVKLQNNSGNEFLQSLTYTVTPNSGLSNGDKVTVTFNYDKIAARQAGYRIKETSKKYTVEGLNRCLMDISEISDEALTAMEEQAEAMVEAELTNLKTKDVYEVITGKSAPIYGLRGSTREVEILDGAYFLALKEGFSADCVNFYTFFYKVPVSVNDSGETITGEMYYAVVFYDLTEDGGDVYVNLAGAALKGPFNGRNNCYNQRITAFADRYEVQKQE